MYIAVKTNENLDKLVKNLLTQNLSINVRRHVYLTFIDVNLKEYGYGAFINFSEKCVRIHSFTTDNVEVLINFEDLELVYDLD